MFVLRGKYVAGIKGNLQVQWLTLPSVQQGDLRTSIPIHDHFAILQDLIPDTPCSTVSAAVTLLLCLSWAPALLCWVHHVLGVSLRKCWQMDSTHQEWSGFLPSVQLSALISISVSAINSALFNINPKVCRNVVAPVKVLCQMLCSPVRGDGNETNPSYAVNNVHRARGPFSIPERQAKV